MTENNDNLTDKENTGLQSGQFSFHKIYVKDISFETPNSPEIFGMEWNPSVNMQLSSEAQSVENTGIESMHEIVLTVTVTVSLGDKTAYLIEVQQAGIFQLQGFPEEVLTRIAATVCPNLLFPFAREVVSDIVTRGGFPQLLLAPVNFDALYRKQQETAEISSTDSEVKH